MFRKLGGHIPNMCATFLGLCLVDIFWWLWR